MVYRNKMLSNSRKIVVLLGALLISVSVSAQYSQSSYSIFGIGEVNYGSLAQNSSMAGVGLSYSSQYYVNTLNPAAFGMNENAVFHIGGSLDFRNYSNEISEHQSSTGGFKDFVVSLPIKMRKWNLGIGIAPYSVVSYSYQTDTEGPDNTREITSLNGKGGLDEAFVTNGFRLGKLYLGLKVGFLFGTIQKESTSYLEGNGGTAFGNTVITTRENFSDVYFQLGAIYKMNLTERSFLNFGATYISDTKVNGKTSTYLDLQSNNGDRFSRDTLDQRPDPSIPGDPKPFIRLPGRASLGISYEKFQQFNIGLDVHTQDWTKYRDFDNEAVSNFDQTYRIAVGGEIIPNSDNPGFFGLNSYRFGLYYEKTPYVIRDEAVKDFGITIGTSFPLSAYWGLSSVNLGITYGQRGSVGNGLIKENYFKIDFGFSVQDVTWFTRTKYN
jgi:hypothetical protein